MVKLFIIILLTTYQISLSSHIKKISDTGIINDFENDKSSLKYYNNKFCTAFLNNRRILLYSFDEEGKQKEKVNLEIPKNVFNNLNEFTNIDDLILNGKKRYFLIGGNLLYYEEKKFKKSIKLPHILNIALDVGNDVDNKVFVCRSYNKSDDEKKYKFYGVLIDTKKMQICDSVFFDFSNLIFCHFNFHRLFEAYGDIIYAVDPLTYQVQEYNIITKEYNSYRVNGLTQKFQEISVLDSILLANRNRAKNSIEAVVNLKYENIERMTNIYKIDKDTLLLISSLKNYDIGRYETGFFYILKDTINKEYKLERSYRVKDDNIEIYDFYNEDLYVNNNNGVIRNKKLFKLISSPNSEFLKNYDGKSVGELFDTYLDYELEHKETFQLYEVNLP